MREHDERLVLRTTAAAKGAMASHGLRKRQPKTLFPEALLGILHDERAQDVYVDWAAFGVKRGQTQCLQKGKGRPFVSRRLVHTNGCRIREARAQNAANR